MTININKSKILISYKLDFINHTVKVAEFDYDDDPTKVREIPNFNGYVYSAVKWKEKTAIALFFGKFWEALELREEGFEIQTHTLS
ncbi:MAG: hypothetical protein BAJALOKI1v1_2240001 [Promethearchaeota archaeon]|nr:MAG: hypothetical protein BAJALOKI1v1_2240001 [Candidatus Lokiarchaeota archaeon]